MSAFATVGDLASYWRPLTSDEQPRATIMLDLASDRLRVMGDDVGINLDEKSAANTAFANTIKWVVMEAVKRAISTPTNQPPVESWAQTAGPYSENYKYTNPSGDLWFKKSELSAIGIYGKQRLGNVSTTHTEIYS